MVITGGTRPAKKDEPEGTEEAAKRTWFQSRVSDPLYEQVAAGVTAESLAQSAAMGLAVGFGPLPGLSSIIVGVLSVTCGYNMVAGQVAQLVMAPSAPPAAPPLLPRSHWPAALSPELQIRQRGGCFCALSRPCSGVLGG